MESSVSGSGSGSSSGFGDLLSKSRPLSLSVRRRQNKNQQHQEEQQQAQGEGSGDDASSLRRSQTATPNSDGISSSLDNYHQGELAEEGGPEGPREQDSFVSYRRDDEA